MPRYFFHISHGEDRSDLEGVDLPDDNEAWHQATLACGEMLRDLDGALLAGPEWRMRGTDEQGRKLFEIHLFAERFEMEPATGDS